MTIHLTIEFRLYFFVFFLNFKQKSETFLTSPEGEKEFRVFATTTNPKMATRADTRRRFSALITLLGKRAHLLRRVLLLFDILGRVGGDERSGVYDDLAVLEDDLPLHPGLDLPGGGDLLLLAGLPFLCKPEAGSVVSSAWLATTTTPLRKTNFSVPGANGREINFAAMTMSGARPARLLCRAVVGSLSTRYRVK